MQLHVGTSGFGYPEWKGQFYPEKISPKEMLRFYSTRLKTVEINHTFYHMPTERILEAWAEQVPDDFVFAFKAPQIITHLKRLRDVDSEIEYLLHTLSILDRKLGPILFQFPKSFRADLSALKNFLLLLGNSACAFEFRSPAWHTDATLDLLRAGGHSLCIVDTDENPINEITSTAKWGYLRLRRTDYAHADLTEWMHRIAAQKWNKAFVYFEHEDKAKGPELAMRFAELVVA